MSSVIQLSGFSGPGHFWSCSIGDLLRQDLDSSIVNIHLGDTASSLAKAKHGPWIDAGARTSKDYIMYFPNDPSHRESHWEACT